MRNGTLWLFGCLALVVAESGLESADHSQDAGNDCDPALRTMVEEDWLRQEQRMGRSAPQPETIRAVLDRAVRLSAVLRQSAGESQRTAEFAALTQLQAVVGRIETLTPAEREEVYRRLRWILRGLILRQPALASKPLVFMKRHRFICQMLHEYLGYFYDYGDLSGGGVYVLDQPGRSLATRDLIQGRLPRGNYTTLALSYDARTLYFAFAERAEIKPDFYSAQRRCFHLYALDADGNHLRPLSDGGQDDFDPCPLPDGGLAFISTRRGGFGRCHNPWEPLPTYTLHRMEADGSAVRTLSFHETNEWHPWVLNDGRIIYTRWDYVDRSAANYHGLWISNPDGSNPISLFGNYTQQINACYQPRSIPGSSRILFVAGAHHADVGGSLVLVDPRRARLDRQTGEDVFDAIEVVTPEVCFPEAPGWPKSYFHSPWPLSENEYLVSFSFDPLPGMGPGIKDDTKTGLYYWDRHGNFELLYRDPAIGCMYPLPLSRRPIPPRIPSTLDPQLGDEGECILADVQRSLQAWPASRPIRQLRIYQVLPKTASHVANQPRLGYANAESARMLLGTVPVEADGSAWFRVPARKPLYFQAVDAQGRAVQTMRSVAYLQPGERRSCVGCHEPTSATPAPGPLLALQRQPSLLAPGPEGTRPFSFPRLVQPVLDRHCVVCHDGAKGAGKSGLALTGDPAETFSRSYSNLKPYVRWHEWGGASISQTATRPGRQGADTSALLRVLADATHTPQVRLGEEDRLRLEIWLDANAPFYGTYGPAEQLAQRAGQDVAPPEIQ